MISAVGHIQRYRCVPIAYEGRFRIVSESPPYNWNFDSYYQLQFEHFGIVTGANW